MNEWLKIVRGSRLVRLVPFRLGPFALLFGLMLSNGTTIAADFTLSTSSLSFGSQLIGVARSTKTLTLTNTGGATLSFAEAAAAPFVASDSCAGSAAAGATCTISVKFSPTAAGSFSGSLTVTDTTTLSSQDVQLTGTGVPTSLSASSLAFAAPQILGTTSAAKKITLTNSPTSAPVNSVILNTSGDFAATLQRIANHSDGHSL